MRLRYWLALLVAGAGVGAVVWSVLAGGSVGGIGLVLAAASLPVAVLLAVSARLDVGLPVGSLVGGAIIGPIVAVASHALVFGFAYVFFLGFADAAVSLLDAYRIDPAFVSVAGSPWTLLLFFELVLVAPLTEEVGKALGASVERPSSRSEAFMAGVTAGVGFAIAENLLFVSGALLFGPSWEAVAVARMIGAAVHPLASGLVVMGWWEWRQGRDLGLLIRRFLTGAGVHAAWNGSIVVLGIAGEAYGIDQLLGLGALGIAYASGLGAVAAGVLWRVTVSVADDGSHPARFEPTDVRSIAAWVVLAASLLIPVAVLFLAYPEFVGV